jgi:hypothetical protein
MMLTRKRPRFALAVAVCTVGATVGATLAISTGTSGTGAAPSALGSLSVFAETAPPRAEPEIADLLGGPWADRGDLSKLRVLGEGLGRFDSRLVALPSASGGTICYSLLAARNTDPGMSYCYPPFAPSLPAPLAGLHFNVSTLYSALDGTPDVQVFGLAFDDVEGIRVRVDDAWEPAVMVKNGFYLDLPGRRLNDVEVVEAHLADGSTQAYALPRTPGG